MKRVLHLLSLALLLSSFASLAQYDSLRFQELAYNYYKPMFGPVIGLNTFRYPSLELGVDMIHMPRASVLQSKTRFFYTAFVSTELQFGKQFVFGSKMGSEIYFYKDANSLPPIGFGLNLIHYKANKEFNNVLRPTIGVTNLMYALNYGYNFRLDKQQTVLPLNKHVIELKLRIAPIIYLVGNALDACCSGIVKAIR
jgi:hypothetical protein